MHKHGLEDLILTKPFADALNQAHIYGSHNKIWSKETIAHCHIEIVMSSLQDTKYYAMHMTIVCDIHALWTWRFSRNQELRKSTTVE